MNTRKLMLTTMFVLSGLTIPSVASAMMKQRQNGSGAMGAMGGGVINSATAASLMSGVPSAAGAGRLATESLAASIQRDELADLLDLGSVEESPILKLANEILAKVPDDDESDSTPGSGASSADEPGELVKYFTETICAESTKELLENSDDSAKKQLLLANIKLFITKLIDLKMATFKKPTTKQEVGKLQEGMKAFLKDLKEEKAKSISEDIRTIIDSINVTTVVARCVGTALLEAATGVLRSRVDAVADKQKALVLKKDECKKKEQEAKALETEIARGFFALNSSVAGASATVESFIQDAASALVKASAKVTELQVFKQTAKTAIEEQITRLTDILKAQGAQPGLTR